MNEGGLRLLWNRILRQIILRIRPLTIRSSFAHSMPRGLPAVDFDIRHIQVQVPGDIQIAERIIVAFKKAWKEELDYPNTVNQDAWDTIEHNQHKELFEILEKNDPRKLADYLSNMHNKSVTYGISDFNESIYLKTSPGLRREHMAFVKDRLICLAEAVGVITYKRSGNNDLYVNAESLVHSIQEAIGIDMTPPDIDGGLVKLRVGIGFFSLRDLYSLYTAWRVSQLVGQHDGIAEIGGGLGKAALYAHRFGLKDYSIFDLPQMNSIQAWYLIKSGVPVSLYGEKINKESVKVLPWRGFGQNRTFALTLNVDSFTEMEAAIVTEYLRKIKQNTQKYLLSINHEKEFVVGDTSHTSGRLVMFRLIKEVGGFKQVYRFPFWLRSGYMEELYSVQNNFQ